MATVRNSRGFRDFGRIGADHKKISNAPLRRERAPVRPSIAKDPLQARRVPDVRDAPVRSPSVLQRTKAGKRNGPVS